MNDDELRRQLERRAAAGRSGQDVVRRELLPAVSAAMDQRPERVVGRGLSPVGALAAVAVVMMLAVGLAVVRPPSPAPGGSLSPTPPDIGISPATDTQRVGDFTLTLTAAQTDLSVDAPLDVIASLAYDGDHEEVALSGVFNLIAGFSARQLDGSGFLGAGWDEPCSAHAIRRGEPIARSFRDYTAAELSPGRWEIIAIADFYVGEGCQGEHIRIEASVVVGIQASTGYATPSLAPTPSPEPVSTPTTNQVSQGPFTLTIRADRGRYAPGQPITVDAALTFSGPQRSVNVRGAGLFDGFNIEQLDGDARMTAVHILPCFTLQVLRDEPARLGFVKSGEIDGEPPFDRAFFEDPQLRLPAGRWEISVGSRFYLDDCGGEPVSLRTSVVIDVTNDPAPPEPTPTAFPTPPPTPSQSPTLWPPPTPEAWLPCDAVPLTIVDHAGIVADCSAAWPPVPPVPNYLVNNIPVANPGTDLRVIELRYTVLEPDACYGEGAAYQLEISPTGSSDATAPLIVVPSEECDEWGPIDFVGRRLLVRLSLTRPMPAAWVVFHEQYEDRFLYDEDAIHHGVGAEAPFGRLSLSMSSERETFLSTEQVSVAAEITYRTDFGVPTEPVTLYGAFPTFGFVYEQLDGDGRVWGNAMAECAPLVVEPGQPIAVASDPSLRLPPGLWRISVTASFAADSCDADTTALHAYVIVRVRD